MSVTVIADIVGSRSLPDRASAQQTLDAIIAEVDEFGPGAIQRLTPTVGDEQQGIYETVEMALSAILLLRLALPADVQCRFGLGIGEIRSVPAAGGSIPDGPAWWAARRAIDEARALQQRAVPAARTRVVADSDESSSVQDAVKLANAYALVRDQLIDGMSARARRLTYGRCRGRTQRELAASENITQSAVSQTLSHSGAAALVATFVELSGEWK
ncbi:hypothetical protein FHX49_001672 [Microbacterium endophyticum]|uniref:SatD family protein n=1 Tax=Microbacterium endophyticum TaxID=1526412 RepID=A0A7W4YNE9_9MICO|nr:SatD family protein [Microbacterium endophyticum]MBB2976102.1 hypothetical protein [Microbacterium endophyticum]NIK34980.1 hypothetical protein [Microbacterium endophyticum]